MISFRELRKIKINLGRRTFLVLKGSKQIVNKSLSCYTNLSIFKLVRLALCCFHFIRYL